MPSPLAHALVGAAVYAALAPRGEPGRDVRPLALAAFAGVAADLDFLPGLLSADPSRYHHSVSHSLTAVFAFVLVTAFVTRGLGGLPRRSAILGLAYASHLVLDLASVDHTSPRGIPLFWPITDATFLSPVPLFTDIHHGASWRAFVNWHNAGAVLIEALVVGTPVAAFCAVRLARAGRGETAGVELPGGRVGAGPEPR